jgi:hypothetical protein
MSRYTYLACLVGDFSSLTTFYTLPSVLSRVHNGQPLYPIISQLNPFRTVAPILNIHINTFLLVYTYASLLVVSFLCLFFRCDAFRVLTCFALRIL